MSPGLLAGFPTSAAVTPYILYVQFEQEFTNMGSDWCLEQHEKCAEISISEGQGHRLAD